MTLTTKPLFISYFSRQFPLCNCTVKCANPGVRLLLLLAQIIPQSMYSAISLLYVADYSQADHLPIQKKIPQDLNRPRMVVQEAQVAQEVLEAHVLIHPEGPKNVQITITTIIHGNNGCNFKNFKLGIMCCYFLLI